MLFDHNPLSSSRRSRRGLQPRPFVVGFVPLIDAAVLIAAKELGLFTRHGVPVKLQRELGGATVREKLLHGELDAAHVPASAGFVIRCGLATVARPCLTAFVLALNGSALTLSRELCESGLSDAAGLRCLIGKAPGRRKVRLAVEDEFSTQNYDLRRWLHSGGIDPDRDLEIVKIPSLLMPQGLQEGHLDGYWAGEPWGTIAARSGLGQVVVTSAQITPAQPEKVLLVTEDFVAAHTEEHLAIVAALIEASAFCGAPEHRAELVRMLAQPRYLGVPEEILGASLLSPGALGTGGSAAEFITYQSERANVPDRAKGRRVFEDVRQMPSARKSRALRPDAIRRVFREDLYQQAEGRRGASSPSPPGRMATPAAGFACAY